LIVEVARWRSHILVLEREQRMSMREEGEVVITGGGGSSPPRVTSAIRQQLHEIRTIASEVE
jgi:hypothetical protein